MLRPNGGMEDVMENVMRARGTGGGRAGQGRGEEGGEGRKIKSPVGRHDRIEGIRLNCIKDGLMNKVADAMQCASAWIARQIERAHYRS